jgi:hypothetical protein
MMTTSTPKPICEGQSFFTPKAWLQGLGIIVMQPVCGHRHRLHAPGFWSVPVPEAAARIAYLYGVAFQKYLMQHDKAVVSRDTVEG